MFKWNLLYFSLCPLTLAISTNTTEKTLDLSFLLPPITSIRFSMSQTVPFQLSAFPHTADAPVP